MFQNWKLEKQDSFSFGVVYDPHLSDVAPASRKDDYAKAALEKLSFVEADIQKRGGSCLILAGDILHKKAVSTKFTCTLAKFFAQYRIPVYGIVGNHDVYRGNVDFLPKTSLGVLFASGVITHLNGSLLVRLRDFKVHLRGFDFCPALMLASKAQDLLEEDIDTSSNRGLFTGDGKHTWRLAVAHGFISGKQRDFTVKDFVDVPSFEAAGFHALFLGHDHVAYPVQMKGSLLLARGGGLMRGTKHAYNMARGVTYDLVTVTKDSIDIESIPVPHAPPDEVYSTQQINREGLSKKLKSFMKSLETSSKNFKGEEDIFSILEGLSSDAGLLDTCFSYLGEGGVVRKGADEKQRG